MRVSFIPEQLSLARLLPRTLTGLWMGWPWMRHANLAESSWGEDAGAVTGFPQKRQWSYFRNWEYKRFPPDAESPLNLRLSPARGESKPGICPWRIRSWWRRERESDTCQINRVHVVENGKRAHVFSGTNDSPQPYQIPSLGQYDYRWWTGGGIPSHSFSGSGLAQNGALLNQHTGCLCRNSTDAFALHREGTFPPWSVCSLTNSGLGNTSWTFDLWTQNLNIQHRFLCCILKGHYGI